MTLSTASGRSTYTGDGSIASFSVPWRIFSQAHLDVREIDTAGNITQLTLGTHYSVTGVNQYAGFTITRAAGILPVGYQWIVRRAVPTTQVTDLRNQSGAFLEVIEDELDYIVMAVQQVTETLGRMARMPINEAPSESAMTLPSVANRAGKAQGFALDGSLTVVTPQIFNFTGSGGGGFEINARQLGAVGDGIANDRAAIQRAIDACVAAGGGKVRLPAGTYRLIGSYPGYVADTSGGWPYDGPVQHLSLTGSNVEIIGDGMGRTTIVSGQASCVIAAHHGGQLDNIVLRGITFKNDLGLNTQWTTNVMYWNGRITVVDCEFKDWSIGFYGRTPGRGSQFIGNRFTWSFGRECIGYIGHASNWSHPTVGIIWPGDDVLVANNYFDGALSKTWRSSGVYPDSLPIDWAYDGSGINWWPDTCRESADGLVIQFNSGGTFVGNRIRNNGVEGILVDYNSTYTDPAQPISISGNMIDATDWSGTQLHYPSYGISVNNRRSLSIAGNAVSNCDIGIRANACQGAITGNGIADCAHGMWVLGCNDTVISGNAVQVKMTLNAGNLSVIYNCERGIFLTTPTRCRVHGNTIRGPTSGWANGTKTTTATVSPGQMKIYLNNTTGLVPTVVGVTSGNWLSFGYVAGVSLGVPIPIASVGSDGGGPFVMVLNSDWAATLGSYGIGATVTVFNDNPFYIAGVASSEAVDSEVNGNTISGYLYGISHSVASASPNYLLSVGNHFVGNSIAAIGPNQIVNYVYDGSLPFPSLTATGQVKGLTLVAEGLAASAGAGPHLVGKFTSDADAALDFFVYDHDNVNEVYDAHYNGGWIASHTSAFIVSKYGGRYQIIPKSGLTKGAGFSIDENADPMFRIDAAAGLITCRLLPLYTYGRQRVYNTYNATQTLTTGHEYVTHTGAGVGDIYVVPLASAGTWCITINNKGSNALTMQRSGASDLLNGAASVSLAAGKWCVVQSTGGGNEIHVMFGP